MYNVFQKSAFHYKNKASTNLKALRVQVMIETQTIQSKQTWLSNSDCWFGLRSERSANSVIARPSRAAKKTLSRSVSIRRDSESSLALIVKLVHSTNAGGLRYNKDLGGRWRKQKQNVVAGFLSRIFLIKKAAAAADYFQGCWRK